MSTSSLSIEHKELIEKIAKNEGFTDFEIIANPGSFKGDNYLGEITVVQVKDKKFKSKLLNLVLKSSQQDETLRNITPVVKFFKREVFMYNTIFKQFLDLSKKYDIEKHFETFPKCYDTMLTNTRECLVLENLKEKGYSHSDRKETMTSLQVKSVFKAYAKLHTISYVLRKEDPEKYAPLMENTIGVLEEHHGPEKMSLIIKIVFENLIKLVQDEPLLLKHVLSFAQNAAEFFQSSRRPTKHSVFIHGDSWCNNIFFKYEKSANLEKPNDVKFIDFQLSCAGLPVQDLAYFFYVCSSKNIMDNYVYYLKKYHTTLKKCLEQFNIPINDVMSYEELLEDWNNYAKYGLIMAEPILKAMLGDSEEATDMADEAQKGRDIAEALVTKSFHSAEYTKRIKNIATSLIENRLL